MGQASLAEVQAVLAEREVVEPESGLLKWATVELTVRDLGFPQGATTADLCAQAVLLGLQLCPLELGPHLRLHYLDQPKGYWGQPIRQHQAPSRSITILSASLLEDDDFPKGFYIRKIKGELWIRGYRARVDHLWEADDHLLFCRP